MRTGKPSQLQIFTIFSLMATPLYHVHLELKRRTISIRKYFKPVLPLPSPEDTGVSICATCEANMFIQQALEEPTPSKKHKYTVYTDYQQVKVGKFTDEHGNAAALKKF